MNDDLKAKLLTLTSEPGCYLMKDKNNNIIYVGKAKNLKNRVNQYFTGSHSGKTQKMVSLVYDFDFIITDSEKEALLLEINLIKKFRPRYNIMFIDDKTYPYIRLTDEKYPTLSVVRTLKKDKKNKYFGPYPNVDAANKTIKILRSIYPFRRCKSIPNRLCMYYHLGQCLGPCVYEIDPKVYEEMSLKVIDFLNGNTKDTRNALIEKMNIASDNLEFERANDYKKSIEAIDYIVSNQTIDKKDNVNRDVFSYYSDKGYISIQGFMVRNGLLIEREFKLFPLYGDDENEFLSFILQYYDTHSLPKELILSSTIDISELQLDTKIIQPIRGEKKKLLDMCLNNAKRKLELKFEAENKKESDVEKANLQLNTLLNKNISRVELFDNSHTSGTFTVSALVVYDNGIPSKKDYRLYKLSSKNSDYDSMKEVIYRRYYRLLIENKPFPDAIIMDGGLIQVNAAKQILNEFNIDILVLGLVKDQTHSTRALIDDSGNEFNIDKDSELFFMLSRMQDEVHRFAITYHRKLREKAQTKSILDEIEGVGNKTKLKVLKHFKSFKALKESSLKDLEEVVNKKVAKNIYNALHDEL